MFNKKDKAEEEISEVAFEDLEPTELSAAYHKPSNVRIIMDSCADFAPGIAEQLGVDIIQFPYVGPDGEHYDDGWKSISAHEFFEGMRKDKKLRYTTSAITPGHYLEVFERAAKQGTPTVYLCLTSALSSSYYAAEQAADMVREKWCAFVRSSAFGS